MRVLALLFGILLIVGTVQAELLLGPVDRDKIKSFKNYFGRFYDVEKPIFEDKEFEERIREEAKEIFEWISKEENWPAKLIKTPELQSDLMILYYYFGNSGIEKARSLSLSMKEQAAEDHPEDAELQIERFWFYKRLEKPLPKKYLYYAKRAIKANPEKAKKENLHYWIATEAYNEGLFLEAKENIEKQYEANPEFEDTTTKRMIFNMWVEQWGHVPEKIQFIADSDGVLIPHPIQVDKHEETI